MDKSPVEDTTNRQKIMDDNAEQSNRSRESSADRLNSKNEIVYVVRKEKSEIGAQISNKNENSDIINKQNIEVPKCETALQNNSTLGIIDEDVKREEVYFEEYAKREGGNFEDYVMRDDPEEVKYVKLADNINKVAIRERFDALKIADKFDALSIAEKFSTNKCFNSNLSQNILSKNTTKTKTKGKRINTVDNFDIAGSTLSVIEESLKLLGGRYNSSGDKHQRSERYSVLKQNRLLKEDTYLSEGCSSQYVCKIAKGRHKFKKNKYNSSNENKHSSSKENKYLSPKDNKYNSSKENKYNSSKENKYSSSKGNDYNLLKENKICPVELNSSKESKYSLWKDIKIKSKENKYLSCEIEKNLSSEDINNSSCEKTYLTSGDNNDSGNENKISSKGYRFSSKLKQNTLKEEIYNAINPLNQYKSSQKEYKPNSQQKNMFHSFQDSLAQDVSFPNTHHLGSIQDVSFLDSFQRVSFQEDSFQNASVQDKPSSDISTLDFPYPPNGNCLKENKYSLQFKLNPINKIISSENLTRPEDILSSEASNSEFPRLASGFQHENSNLNLKPSHSQESTPPVFNIEDDSSYKFDYKEFLVELKILQTLTNKLSLVLNDEADPVLKITKKYQDMFLELKRNTANCNKWKQEYFEMVKKYDRLMLENKDVRQENNALAKHVLKQKPVETCHSNDSFEITIKNLRNQINGLEREANKWKRCSFILQVHLDNQKNERKLGMDQIRIEAEAEKDGEKRFRTFLEYMISELRTHVEVQEKQLEKVREQLEDKVKEYDELRRHFDGQSVKLQSLDKEFGELSETFMFADKHIEDLEKKLKLCLGKAVFFMVAKEKKDRDCDMLKGKLEKLNTYCKVIDEDRQNFVKQCQDLRNEKEELMDNIRSLSAKTSANLNRVSSTGIQSKSSVSGSNEIINRKELLSLLQGLAESIEKGQVGECCEKQENVLNRCFTGVGSTSVLNGSSSVLNRNSSGLDDNTPIINGNFNEFDLYKKSFVNEGSNSSNLRSSVLNIAKVLTSVNGLSDALPNNPNSLDQTYVLNSTSLQNNVLHSNVLNRANVWNSANVLNSPNVLNNTLNNPNILNDSNNVNNLNILNNPNSLNNPYTLNNPNTLNNPSTLNNFNTLNNPNTINNPSTLNGPSVLINANLLNNSNNSSNPDFSNNSTGSLSSNAFNGYSSVLNRNLSVIEGAGTFDQSSITENINNICIEGGDFNLDISKKADDNNVSSNNTLVASSHQNVNCNGDDTKIFNDLRIDRIYALIDTLKLANPKYSDFEKCLKNLPEDAGRGELESYLQDVGRLLQKENLTSEKDISDTQYFT